VSKPENLGLTEKKKDEKNKNQMYSKDKGKDMLRYCKHCSQAILGVDSCMHCTRESSRPKISTLFLLGLLALGCNDTEQAKEPDAMEDPKTIYGAPPPEDIEIEAKDEPPPRFQPSTVAPSVSKTYCKAIPRKSKTASRLP